MICLQHNFAIHVLTQSRLGHLSVLYQVWQHHYQPTPPLKHHLPEVLTGVLHRGLCNNEPFVLLVALHRDNIILFILGTFWTYTFDTYINKGSIDVVQPLCLEYHPPFVSYVGTMMERMKRYKLVLSLKGKCSHIPRLLPSIFDAYSIREWGYGKSTGMKTLILIRTYVEGIHCSCFSGDISEQ